jgi:hypothetical protein
MKFSPKTVTYTVIHQQIIQRKKILGRSKPTPSLTDFEYEHGRWIIKIGIGRRDRMGKDWQGAAGEQLRLIELNRMMDYQGFIELNRSEKLGSEKGSPHLSTGRLVRDDERLVE